MPIRTVAAERSTPASRVLAASILCVAMTVATEAAASNLATPATGPPPIPMRPVGEQLSHGRFENVAIYRPAGAWW